MAAKKATEGTPATATTTEPEEPKRVPLKPAEERALFVAAEKAEKDVNESEAMLENSKKALSAAIQDIWVKLGKGPFIYKGRRLNVSSRHGTYFFKGDVTQAKQIG